MHHGTVKWFNNSKGYGFIIPEQGGRDLFVHYSSINMEGYKTLKAGQPVQYDVIDGPKGQHATNILFASESTSNTEVEPVAEQSIPETSDTDNFVEHIAMA
ncbi:MAG: cold shock domain-containing protein [Pseudomonadales bacterium]|nr:cold shock domain-containing protein [Pseudomonadales bacterium]